MSAPSFTQRRDEEFLSALAALGGVVLLAFGMSRSPALAGAVVKALEASKTKRVPPPTSGSGPFWSANLVASAAALRSAELRANAAAGRHLHVVDAAQAS